MLTVIFSSFYSNGLVVAHYDRDEIGKNYSEDPKWNELMSAVYSSRTNGSEPESMEQLRHRRYPRAGANSLIRISPI